MSRVVIGQAANAAEAYSEGMEAASCGREFESCPYSADVDLVVAWRAGWTYTTDMNTRLAAHFHN